MSSTECPHCGEPILKSARACGYCGAPVPVRRNSLLIVAALAALGVLVVVVAALMFFARAPNQDGAAVDPGAGAGTGAATSPGTGTGTGASTPGDFAWLETAMKKCDEDAAKDSKALHFLVTPLVDEPRDEPGWRRISINDIGNGILVNADDMLAGLRRKALRVSNDEYIFSVRNEASRDVLTWKPSINVRKFVINDAAGIEQFKVQFHSNDASRTVNWGATFVRQQGNCYWVNGILRN